MTISGAKLSYLYGLYDRQVSYLYYLYDNGLSYFQYKSYSFSAPRIDVKEQTLPHAKRRMVQGHKSRVPQIGCRPRPGEAVEKKQRRKTIVTSVAQIGNWVVEDGIPQALKRSR